MSSKEYPCLFDNDKECPVRTALKGRVVIDLLVQKACPICPIRLKMLEKAS